MSDYFNSFANPQSGGGQDIPQPGTPAWFQWLQSMGFGQGQGSQPGAPPAGPPPGPLAANPANLPASPNMANMSVVGLPSSSGFTLPNGTPAPAAADAALVRGGVSQGAHAAPPPPVNPPVAAASVKQQPPKPAARKPAAAAPTTPIGGGAGNVMEAPTGTPRPPDSTTSQGGGYDTPTASVTPSTGPLYPASDVSLYPHALIAGAPSNGAVPNLGYYRPTMGNAQGSPTWVPQGATGSPQMFRGPLALPGSQNYYGQPAGAAPPPAAAAPAVPAPAAAASAAAPGPGPIAPGVGTLWLRKLFGGGQPTAA